MSRHNKKHTGCGSRFDAPIPKVGGNARHVCYWHRGGQHVCPCGATRPIPTTKEETAHDLRG
jgi:hypothetical protein